MLSGYVAWVWLKPRVIGRADWVVTLPGGPLTLLQIAIGIVDLVVLRARHVRAAARRPAYRFHQAGGDLRLGDAARFCQPSPGGLGVFDAAMLVALIEFDKEELVAGLLLFRLLYYVVPFALSLADPRRARIVARCRAQAVTAVP